MYRHKEKCLYVYSYIINTRKEIIHINFPFCIQYLQLLNILYIYLLHIVNTSTYWKQWFGTKYCTNKDLISSLKVKLIYTCDKSSSTTYLEYLQFVLRCTIGAIYLNLLQH